MHFACISVMFRHYFFHSCFCHYHFQFTIISIFIINSNVLERNWVLLSFPYPFSVDVLVVIAIKKIQMMTVNAMPLGEWKYKAVIIKLALRRWSLFCFVKLTKVQKRYIKRERTRTVTMTWSRKSNIIKKKQKGKGQKKTKKVEEIKKKKPEEKDLENDDVMNRIKNRMKKKEKLQDQGVGWR